MKSTLACVPGLSANFCGEILEVFFEVRLGLELRLLLQLLDVDEVDSAPAPPAGFPEIASTSFSAAAMLFSMPFCPLGALGFVDHEIVALRIGVAFPQGSSA